MADYEDAAPALPHHERNAVRGSRSETGGRERWRERDSDHYDATRRQFFNPWANTDRGLRELLRWQTAGLRRAWPTRVVNRTFPPPPLAAPSGRAVVTSIGHASVLLRVGDTTVLTDPVFSTHAGLFGRFGAARVRPPGVAPAALPPIDVVFVSHNHFDHLDVASLRWLDAHHAPLFVTCLGLRRPLERRGLRRVVELDWWQSTTVGSLTLTVTPAQHWSKRGLFDLRRSLWGGCYLHAADGARVYFAGDTGYAPYFNDIRARLGAPDLALLPIGAYEPRWFMRDAHMNPDDAVRAHRDLGAAVSVPIHYGTFRLTDEGFEEPLEDLTTALEVQGLSVAAFRRLDVGESAVL
jgi:L-ascorbate metabolism protein UlaG (beta-lactamase superfamily)